MRVVRHWNRSHTAQRSCAYPNIGRVQGHDGDLSNLLMKSVPAHGREFETR